MSTSQVFLILLSGLGVVHGLLLAAFLWFYPKGLSTSNKILSILLLVLSFRIGKSVILEFAEGVHLQLIFLGLATLLLIGPLFYLYTRSVLEKATRVNTAYLLHFVPFLIGLAFIFWIDKERVKTTPISFFVAIFCIYYGHYLAYLFLSHKQIRKYKAAGGGNTIAIRWLSILLYALMALWVVYVLNLVEDRVPYILGPILYSIIAYGVSFVAIKKGYISQLDVVKYKTTPLSEQEIDKVYEDVRILLVDNELYKNPDLSLNTVSKALKISPQKISMAINSRSGSNFNGFVNHHRIKQAQLMLKDEGLKDYTIASIAYEVGFNSLTSFNTAFKKEMQETPSAYRKGTKL